MTDADHAGTPRGALAQEGFRGRDIFVGGPQGEAEIGGLIAQALGLDPASVLTQRSSSAENEAAWATNGIVRVSRLAPGSALGLHVGIDLFDAIIDMHLFPALACAHGLTIAWSVAEAEEHDWHYHVAFPDGAQAIRWLACDETGDSYAVRLVLPDGQEGSGGG